MTIRQGRIHKSQVAFELIDKIGIDTGEMFTALPDGEQQAIVDEHNKYCADWDGDPITTNDLRDPPEELKTHWQEYHPWSGDVILTECLEQREREYVHLVNTYDLITVVEFEE